MKYETINQLDELDCRKIEQLVDEFLHEQKQYYQQLELKRLKEILLSEYNFNYRGNLKSCRSYNLTISAGDICYIDFGKAYLQEIGYQHFGLVLKVFNGKAFVIPMTSNLQAYKEAYDALSNPNGLSHLMRLGKVDGLYKYSVLFLNDGKYINTARVIDIKSHIDENSLLFQSILFQFVKHLL